MPLVRAKASYHPSHPLIADHLPLLRADPLEVAQLSAECKQKDSELQQQRREKLALRQILESRLRLYLQVRPSCSIVNDAVLLLHVKYG